VKRKNAEYRVQTSQRKENAWCNQGALKGMHIMFFSRNGFALDHPMPIGRTVSGQYYCTYLQGKLFARVKEHLWGKHYESEDDITTAALLLYII